MTVSKGQVVFVQHDNHGTRQIISGFFAINQGEKTLQGWDAAKEFAENQYGEKELIQAIKDEVGPRYSILNSLELPLVRDLVSLPDEAEAVIGYEPQQGFVLMPKVWKGGQINCPIFTFHAVGMSNAYMLFGGEMKRGEVNNLVILKLVQRHDLRSIGAYIQQ